VTDGVRYKREEKLELAEKEASVALREDLSSALVADEPNTIRGEADKLLIAISFPFAADRVNGRVIPTPYRYLCFNAKIVAKPHVSPHPHNLAQLPEHSLPH
jgi:hypothetical protein